MFFKLCIALFVFYFSALIGQTQFGGEWSGKIKVNNDIQYVQLKVTSLKNGFAQGFLFTCDSKDSTFCLAAVDAKVIKVEDTIQKILILSKKIIKYRTNNKLKPKMQVMHIEFNKSRVMASKITNVDKLSELEDTTNHKHDFLLKKRPLTKILKKSFIKQILKKKSTRKKLLFSRKKSKIALKKQEAKLQLKNRIEKSQGELTIKDSIVFIKIYDHIKLDGDSVSVFYNNKLILLKYGLVAYKQSKFYKLIINPKASKSKIVIIAESVGKTPPNSATMEIYNSKNKLLFKKIVESDFKNNVVIDLLHDTKIFKQNIKK